MSREKIGIIGGGQLAFLLSQAAHRLGLTPIALVPSAGLPVQREPIRCFIGDAQDPKVLAAFLSEVEIVIFENEWTDTIALENHASAHVSFFPRLALMRILQDKLLQKEELNRLRIPTAPFMILNRDEAPHDELSKVFEAFGGSCVLKWSRNGYDGKGIMTLDASESPDPSFIDFFQRGFERGSRVYAEPRISFEKELALVALHSRQGEFRSYPLVVSLQNHGTCEWILGTATNHGVSENIQNQAQLYAKKLGEKLGLVGVFALEFFLSAQNELLVNEISPRVHNSGHFSLDVCSSSQFENHLRAVLGLEIPILHTQPYFAMLNLLGPEGIFLEGMEHYLPSPPQNTHLHGYGKASLRPRRKMGHITVGAESLAHLESRIKELETFHKHWIKELENKNELKKI